MPIRVGELLALRAGDVLTLKRPAASPVELSVGGRTTFSALPVRSGNWRAAQISGLVATSIKSGSAR